MDHTSPEDVEATPPDSSKPTSRDVSAAKRWYFPMSKPFAEMSDAERHAFAAEVFLRLKEALAGRR
jgi:hypothetical protein